MKLNKKLAVILLLVGIAFSLVACSDNNSIDGTWNVVKDEGFHYLYDSMFEYVADAQLIFMKDDIVVERKIYGNGRTKEQRSSYSLDGDTMVCGNIVYTIIERTNDKMVLTTAGYTLTLEREKK